MTFSLNGNIVDVVNGRIFPGTIRVNDGKISSVQEQPAGNDRYILPGLIDAHIHIESSMLIPSEFARLSVIHGTTGTVSDPHEIANVLGVEGVKFMIGNGRKVPFRFYFGAPSCVPATPFETAGAEMRPEDVEELLKMPEIKYLSEMMNFPGVVNGDPGVIRKLESARKLKKPADGHAPGLRGRELLKYIEAGITTDHECFTLEEAQEKASLGMKILIREGSAARNFEALCPILGTDPDKVMFCSDDKHPDDLADGHINKLIIRALAKGYPFLDVLRCCTLNPVRHYGLDSGLLQPGDPADLIVVEDLDSFHVREVYIGGILAARDGISLIQPVRETPCNRFNAVPVRSGQFQVQAQAQESDIRVIRACDGQLITGMERARPLIRGGEIISDPSRDLLKLVVVNRYQPSPPAIAFVRGFGLHRGAIASCVAHDSHNIVATGTDDESIAKAVNLVIREKGGISLCDGSREEVLPLPFAGIMSGDDGRKVAAGYHEIDRMAREMGSPLRAPYMTLSFMALLVIPELKLSDRGLFNGSDFTFSSLFYG